jgi:tetratricopeptide (TPR) repeat protein
MKKTIVLAVFLITVTLQGEENKISDPFDLSASSSKVKELGVITQPQVDALERKANELFNNGKYKEAIPALEEFAKKANWLANLIAASLKPYYGASYDDKKSYPYSELEPLIPLESLANSYKKKRNIAFVMQAECLIKIGDNESAVPLLLKALDLIDIDNDLWWKKARNSLTRIIEVNI